MHSWQKNLIGWFTHNSNLVLLKDCDPIQALSSGSDLDFLTKDPFLAHAELQFHLGRPLYLARSGCFYEWGHIDLIPSIDWNGAHLFETKDVFNHTRCGSLSFNVVDPCVDGILSWLRAPLWGGFYKQICEKKIATALSHDSERFIHLLEQAFGKQLAAKLATIAQENRLPDILPLVPQMRRALWWKKLRQNPYQTLSGWILHNFREIRLRLKPPLPWIAVLGPDGSGKSTVIAALKEALSPTIPHVKVFHSRPSVFRAGTPSAGPVTNPQDQIPRGFASSMAKLAFLLTDWWVGYWTVIAPAGARVTMVIFDRFFSDLLVDPKRYRYGGPLWMARVIAKLMPQPHLVILLEAPAEVVQQRKQEVPPAETSRQIAAYRKLVSEMTNGMIVKCDRPVADIAMEIRQLILTKLKERSPH